MKQQTSKSKKKFLFRSVPLITISRGLLVKNGTERNKLFFLHFHFGFNLAFYQTYKTSFHRHFALLCTVVSLVPDHVN